MRNTSTLIVIVLLLMLALVSRVGAVEGGWQGVFDSLDEKEAVVKLVLVGLAGLAGVIVVIMVVRKFQGSSKPPAGPRNAPKNDEVTGR